MVFVSQFLTFEWERYQNKTFTPSSETVHIPPSSLSNALLQNRRFAVCSFLFVVGLAAINAVLIVLSVTC